MNRLTFLKLFITKAKWRRITGCTLIMAHLSSFGCSTVRTIPAPETEVRRSEEQQEAVLDFNRSAEGKKATVIRRPTRTASLTAVQSTALVGKKVKYRAAGEDKTIWVTQVDYPLVEGSAYKKRETNRRAYDAIQFDVRDVQWIEINEPRWNVTSVKLVTDSVSWYSPSGELQQVARDEVETVVLIDRGRGVLEGFGIGIVVGGVLGAIMGYAGGDDPPGYMSFSAEENAVIGGTFFGLLGGIVGIIIGAGRGHQNVYDFDGPDVQELGRVGSPLNCVFRARAFQDDHRPGNSARMPHCAIIVGF